MCYDLLENLSQKHSLVTKYSLVTTKYILIRATNNNNKNSNILNPVYSASKYDGVLSKC